MSCAVSSENVISRVRERIGHPPFDRRQLALSQSVAAGRIWETPRIDIACVNSEGTIKLTVERFLCLLGRRGCRVLNNHRYRAERGNVDNFQFIDLTEGEEQWPKILHLRKQQGGQVANKQRYGRQGTCHERRRINLLRAHWRCGCARGRTTPIGE